MFLITSAAYITSELATEYGKIPPSFLPLQNKRLIEHQLSLLGDNELVVVSLPKGFLLSNKDQEILDDKNIKVIYVPVGFSLGQSIVYVLNVTANYSEPLKILHGDTLFETIPKNLDTYLVAKPYDNYEWAVSEEKNNNHFVYAGYFSFSNQSFLIQAITESNYDFVEGILLYKHRIKVSEILSESWLDFGHANTYYRSKTHLTTQRFFNDLIIDGFSVIKSSTDKNKIAAEANWFFLMPDQLKRYIPALWSRGSDDNRAFYKIEYFYLSSLADLYVYGKNEYFIWQNILNACNDFIVGCMSITAPPTLKVAEKTVRLYHEKTQQRLSKYANESNIDLNTPWIFNGHRMPSINDIANEMRDLISPASGSQQTIIHGDFCFSNILYDFRTKTIKVLDPRGIDIDGEQTIYGDIRYDIAKLAHSVVGLYDFLIAGYFYYRENSTYDVEFKIYSNDTVETLKKYFKNSLFGGMNLDEACTYPILVHLFLSMLPLHKDKPARQKAMLANALRLYLEFKTLNNL